MIALANGERILVVNSSDVGGGAERIGWDLFSAMRGEGLPVELVVGRRHADWPGVHDMPHDRGGALGSRVVWGAYNRLRAGMGSTPRRITAKAVRLLAAPQSVADKWRGFEDFNYPGSWHLLDLAAGGVRLLHAHNLHTEYFDLRALPFLSARVPTLITLHDTWLMSGHCAFSQECDRWRTGCGQCPDLKRYPAIRADKSAKNWLRKAHIFQQSRLHLAAPCQWILDQAKASMLAPGIESARVIHNGVDLSVFRPGDRADARALLALPQHARILLFAANGGAKNTQKDFDTIERALELLRVPAGDRVVCLSLGGTGETVERGSVSIMPVAFERDRERVAAYYRAADVYVHAAKAETFPTVILEALASGTPVVATSVGGIPEQVRTLDSHAQGEATGILVPVRDAAALANSLSQLLTSPELVGRMGENARRDALERFGLERQLRGYLDLYAELLGRSGIMDAYIFPSSL